MRYLVVLLMLLAASKIAAQSYDDDIPKAGLSGILLDERRVRKEREEAKADSIAPPVPHSAIAEDEVDGEGRTLQLDEPTGSRDRRRLGKYDKSPGDPDMAAYAGHEKKRGGRKKKRENAPKKKRESAPEQKRENEPKKKRENALKKKRNNDGKATRQGGPRKRFDVMRPFPKMTMTGPSPMTDNGKARKRP